MQAPRIKLEDTWPKLPPAAVSEPQGGADLTVKITVPKGELYAEKDRHREPGALTVLREKTKQVLMHSGPKSRGVARRCVGRSEVIQCDR